MSGEELPPTSGLKYPAQPASDGAALQSPQLAVLERIASGLERQNEVLQMQCRSLDGIVDALFHLREA